MFGSADVALWAAAAGDVLMPCNIQLSETKTLSQ